MAINFEFTMHDPSAWLSMLRNRQNLVKESGRISYCNVLPLRDVAISEESIFAAVLSLP
jgi:hypothetical protein